MALIIEVVIERLDIKKQVFEHIEKHRKPGTLITSNTSGIPIAQLVQGRSDAFRRRFLGMHFFNPPRYLHLLELIPTTDTAPEVLLAARQFGERVLGKGVVVARDVPGPLPAGFTAVQQTRTEVALRNCSKFTCNRFDLTLFYGCGSRGTRDPHIG